jgi:transcriptional regulator with XRE-family HTH domain
MVSVTVNARIGEARAAAGLTQQALADRIGELEGGPEHKTTRVSAAYLSRLESGERVASVEALRMIAQGLGVSAHWLETGEPDPLELVRELADEALAAGGHVDARELLEVLR